MARAPSAGIARPPMHVSSSASVRHSYPQHTHPMERQAEVKNACSGRGRSLAAREGNRLPAEHSVGREPGVVKACVSPCGVRKGCGLGRHLMVQCEASPLAIAKRVKSRPSTAPSVCASPSPSQRTPGPLCARWAERGKGLSHERQAEAHSRHAPGCHGRPSLAAVPPAAAACVGRTATGAALLRVAPAAQRADGGVRAAAAAGCNIERCCGCGGARPQPGSAAWPWPCARSANQLLLHHSTRRRRGRSRAERGLGR
jgi:hypothetical protein